MTEEIGKSKNVFPGSDKNPVRPKKGENVPTLAPVKVKEIDKVFITDLLLDALYFSVTNFLASYGTNLTKVKIKDIVIYILSNSSVKYFYGDDGTLMTNGIISGVYAIVSFIFGKAMKSEVSIPKILSKAAVGGIAGVSGGSYAYNMYIGKIIKR